MHERYWHLSLFAARFGLIAVVFAYISTIGHVAAGGLSWHAIQLVMLVYLALTTCVAIASRGNQLSPGLQRVQTLLDNTALAIGVPHDPSMAMPVLFFLAINPLEFGVRFGSQSYFRSVVAAAVATLVIVALRATQFDPGLTAEAIGLLVFTWSAIAYGLLTVHGMNRIRHDYDALNARHISAMNTVHFATWLWDFDEDASEINPALEALLDVPAGSFDGRIETMLGYIHPEDREKIKAQLSEKTQNAEGFELRFRRLLSNGDVRWLASRGVPKEIGADGKVRRMEGVLWDVTAEMHAREETEAALARVNSASQTARLGFWEFDAIGRSFKVDDNLQNLLGLPAQDALSVEYILEHVDADEHESVTNALKHGMKYSLNLDLGFGWWDAENNYMYLRARGAARRNVAGQLTGFGGVIEDYTERHHNEVELAALRQRHDVALRAANISAWTMNIETLQFETDEYLPTLLDYDPEKHDGSLDAMLQLMQIDDRKLATKKLHEAIETGQGSAFRYRRKISDGSIRWIQIRGEPSFDSHGKISEIRGASWDVTAEVEAEKQTQAALAKSDAAAQASRIGFWTRDPVTGALDLDENWRRVMGFAKDAPLPNFEASLEYIHAEDRPEFVQKVAHSLQTSEPLVHEYRVFRADNNEMRHFQIRGDTVTNADGELLYHAGFIMDQTEIVELRNESERISTLLETAMTAIPGTAFTTNPAADQVEFIGAAGDMIGIPGMNSSQRLSTVLDRADPRDQAGLREAIDAAMTTGGTIDHLYRVKHLQTGKLQWHHARGRAIVEPDGKSRRLIGVIVDDTEAISRRHEIEALRERYDIALEAADVGGWTWFVDSGVMEIDQNIENLFGLEAGEFNGTVAGFFDRVVAEDRPAIETTVHQQIAAGQGYEIRYRRKLQGRNSRWTMTRGEPVEFDNNGRVTRVAGATWDITQLAELTEALERSNIELDEFAYVASHDLREPLRGLHNYAKFLDEDYRDKLDDEGRRMLAALGRLAQRLETLINDLLHFSRVGRTELAIEEVDLNLVLEDVLQTLEFSLEQQGVEVRIPAPLPRRVCDRVRVGELFRNLITNATKYNDKQKKWIEIGCQNNAFYVRDNGIGIAPEHHERVFTIFKRLHSRDAFGGGSGAGLTIVQRIVARHQGKLWLESEPDKGTTFWFTLDADTPAGPESNPGKRTDHE